MVRAQPLRTNAHPGNAIAALRSRSRQLQGTGPPLSSTAPVTSTNRHE